MGAVRYVWWHKKGVTAHRAAPLADSPTSCPKSTDSKRALETVVPGDGSPFKATAVSSVDGAKVQQNSEITKLSSKKEHSKENPVFVSLLWKVNYFGSGPRSLLITQT